MFAAVRDILVTAPLRSLVLYGPRLQLNLGIGRVDVGFWQGLPLKDICAQMTNSGSDIWAVNEAVCTEKIEASVTALEIFLAVYVYAHVVRASMHSLWGLASSLYRPARPQPEQQPPKTPRP